MKETTDGGWELDQAEALAIQIAARANGGTPAKIRDHMNKVVQWYILNYDASFKRKLLPMSGIMMIDGSQYEWSINGESKIVVSRFNPY